MATSYSALSVRDQVQLMYVAYFGRAGDPGGVDHWIHDINDNHFTIEQVGDNFALQSEAKEKYSYLAYPNQGDPKAFVKAIYDNLFERTPPDNDYGLKYWVDRLTGTDTNHTNPNREHISAGIMIAAIINGAYASTGPNHAHDVASMENKIQVADYFTDQLIANNITWDSANMRDDAAACIADVTWDSATITTGKNTADASVDAFVAVNGQTYTLTNNPDTKTGTSGNDTFNGVRDSNGNVTFHSFDQLDGGDGTDTLIAQGIGALPTNTTTLKNIEKLHLVGAAGNNTLNLINTTGVTHITSEAPTWNYTVAGIGSGIQRIDVLAPAGNTQTFTFQSGAVGGSADSLTLGLQNLGTGAAKTVKLNPVSGTNGFETLNIELSGGPSGKDGKFVTIDDGAATTLATVNVSGSVNGALDLSAAGNGTATTVDASKATGNLVLNLAYVKDIKVTGGKGDDEFQFGNTLNTKDTVAGGDGTDTLAANGAQFGNFTTTASNISGIERIRIQDNAVAAIDVSAFGVNYVRVADRNANALTLNNLANGSTIRFDDDAPGANVLTIKNAANRATDTISLDLRATLATGNVVTTINDVEKINVTTWDAQNAAKLTLTDNVTPLGNDFGLTVNLTGGKDLTLTLTSGHLKNTVDGSAMQANLTADLRAVTGKATLTGGAGSDILIGGTNVDTLTGNSDRDKFVFNNFANADTITDFTVTADDLYIDAKNAAFNTAMTPNGIKVGPAVKIWDKAGSNATMLAVAVSNMISAAVGFTAMQLFTTTNKAALTAAIKAAIAGGNDDRGVAFGKVGNTLYLVYVGDTMTATAMGTKISAIHTIAKVGAGFTAADLFIY